MSDTCVDPAEIQEGDLMAHVDGTADAAVARHVRRCPACAWQVEELAAFQAILTTGLYRHSCPDPEQLIAYHQGELRDGEKLVVAQHLRRCPHCARELAALARKERAGLRERFRAAIEVLEAVPVIPQASPQALRRAAQAAGGRPAPEAARPAPQVYRAGEIDVILSLQFSRAHPRQRDLSGLVHVGGHVPETIGGAKAELYRGEGLIAVATVSPRGHFALTDVEPGEYDLGLLWEDRDIRLKGVQVV